MATSAHSSHPHGRVGARSRAKLRKWSAKASAKRPLAGSARSRLKAAKDRLHKLFH